MIVFFKKTIKLMLVLANKKLMNIGERLAPVIIFFTMNY